MFFFAIHRNCTQVTPMQYFTKCIRKKSWQDHYRNNEVSLILSKN